MHWIDWCITLLPLAFVLGMAVYSRRYVRGVVDYLAAGRVAGRYVIAVGDMESMIGLTWLISAVEVRYQSGFAVAFWESVIGIVGIVIALTGYCVYRFRETKAMSMGQFLEIRYSRPLRIFAAFLRAIGDTMGNAIGPAVAANFFIFFLGFPMAVHVFGLSIPTYLVIVAAVLTMAMIVIWTGGRIAQLITDCFQGLMSYPIFVIVTVYILTNYSLMNDMTPVLMDRVEGQSFLNPFDIEKLRDFNILMVITLLVSRILNRGTWLGNDVTMCGRTPHEQKMAGVLGQWRSGFSYTMATLIGVFVITVMVHQDYAPKARDLRLGLSNQIAAKVLADDKYKEKRTELIQNLAAIPEQRHQIGVDPPLSREQNMDTVYFETARKTLGNDAEGNYLFQQFKTLYHQMMITSVIRTFMPVGIVGLICLLMVMLMLSTDDTRILNCSSGIIQDIVVPLRKKPLTPKQHLFWLRMCSLGVSFFFLLFSAFFVQIDYVMMFMTITLGIWTGGAGAMMVFGLYSRFGNTAGAFSSLTTGSGLTIAGVLIQSNWANHVYPFLEKMGWVSGLDWFLRMVSSPLNPIVVWKMDAEKFPINSYEILLLAMLSSVLMYVVVSLLTYRKPYNLDRMLHRGKYSIDGEKKIKSAWTLKSMWGKLVGITPDYTMGDKVIAWSVFGYAIVFNIGIMFLAVVIWNLIWPWPNEWWRHLFCYRILILGVLIGTISTVWFAIGGFWDLRQLFKDLAKRVDNPLDDGRVEGHVSLMDKALIEEDDAKEDEK
jgi:SSS family solute:Na+ symporter